MLLPVVLTLAFVGLLVFQRLRSKPKQVARIEYWVYIPGTRLPELEALMTAMVAENPHNRPGKPCIGAREGMLFTDIRLRMTVALREKNSSLFRPDLFEQQAVPSVPVLEGLASSRAMIRISYVSEQPLLDDRQLIFLPHMAGAVSRLASGSVVFDRVSEKLYEVQEFDEFLTRSNPLSGFDSQVRVFWVPDLEGGHAETRGMAKVGALELKSLSAPSDQEAIVRAVLEAVAQKIWSGEPVEESAEIDLYGDQFIVAMRPTRDGEFREAHISRVKLNAGAT